MPVIDRLAFQKTTEQFQIFLVPAFPFPSSMDKNGMLFFTALFQKPTDLLKITDSFSFLFGNAGVCQNFICTTMDVMPVYNGPCRTLGSIIQQGVDEKYYISDEALLKWEYMKGAKQEKRVTRDGFEYNYSEGPIAYPDYLDRPARTMLTSEGSVNRSSHIIRDPETGRMRILTPVECERIDGFPDNWTDTGMPERFRYFCMGNALVVQLIEIMGRVISTFNA